ncbi:hydantoinase/oxoprolinase N-terminal domain-containing protein [Dactylosporangium sp. NPDC048998]|uniref:hydantoinase/oxoprolinase N-terminal domain-containing protein n=1 Tax=Dactylosporangium sp. NPDC048998 TaxID=3363976 RepID=UPI00371C5A37
MHSRPGELAHVGVSVHPSRSYAVVVHGSTVVPVEPAAPARTDLDGTIASAVNVAFGMAAGGPDAVTVDISPTLLDAVMRQESELPQVAVVRIVPRAATDPALARSPAAVVERRVAARFTVAGGHDLLGNELCPLDRGQLAAVCAELAAGTIRHVAIVAAGSQARPAHERDVADAIQAAVPGARISVASEYGGQGLVAREATVVLDCALAVLSEQLVDRCERTLSRLPGEIHLRVARGDGGYSTPSRILAMPVVAFGAAEALELCGAAYLENLEDCRVLLSRGGAQVAGEVRHGLALVSPAQPAGIGTELVVPTAVLAPEPDLTLNGVPSRVTDVPVVRAGHEPQLLACIGAAISQPTGWLDEVAFIESAARLESVRRDAEERATAFVMANGAAPGTAYFAEVSTVAVPYSPSGTVRIRVRVAGAPDTGLPRAGRTGREGA